MSSNDLENILQKFNSFTQKPVKFLSVQTDARDDIKQLVKSLYDLTKRQEVKKNKSSAAALPELIVSDFDEEQIWQELELQNSECWDNLVWDVASSMTSKADLEFPIKGSKEPTDHQSNDDEEGDGDEDEREDVISHELRKKKLGPKKNKKNHKPKASVVDDKFFKLQDMEKFLISEEKRDGKPQKVADSDEESIDMFDEIDSDGSNEEEDAKGMKYDDFFENGNEQDDDEEQDVNDEEINSEDDDQESDLEENETKPSKNKVKKVSFADVVSDSENDVEENDNEGSNTDDEAPKEKTRSESTSEKEGKKSEFEMRQERLQQTITRLEKKTLSEAPWQLKGEVDATKRPQNSLLQEVIDFDLTTRPPPIITEQTTITLEDIIKQRVKDKAWDDVVKKEKPVEDVLAFKKTEILDHSKSKQSLAQVYEAEYLKQKHANTDNNDDENEPEPHIEIREAMNSLFSKLDALSHYHYTPKAAQPEVKIVSNTPAISMEEVAPVATSNATLLAPEEVKKKKTGELMSKDERTDTDKNRERRKKKKFQKQKGKLEKVTEQRNTKKSVETNKNDKSLKTSRAFFQQLNDDSTSLIKSNNAKRKNVKNKGL